MDVICPSLEKGMRINTSRGHLLLLSSRSQLSIYRISDGLETERQVNAFLCSDSRYPPIRIRAVTPFCLGAGYHQPLKLGRPAASYLSIGAYENSRAKVHIIYYISEGMIENLTNINI